LNSAGAITQTAGAIVRIGGTADLTASNGNAGITLTSDNQFGTLRLNASDVSIIEGTDSFDNAPGTALLTVDARNLTLDSDGAVTSDAIIMVDELLDVIALNGSAEITLGNTANQLNRISMKGSHAAIVDTSDSELVNVDLDTLSLITTGNISDGEDEVEVRGLADLVTSATGNISLGNAPLQFGSVSMLGNQISLDQQGDVVLNQVTAGGSLSVSSLSGNISATDLSVVNASGAVSLTVDTGTGSIDLSASDNRLGDVSLTADTITLSEADDISIRQITGRQLVLNSAGAILDGQGAQIQVTSDASLTAVTSVVLGDTVADSVRFGTLGVTAADAQITESNQTDISGLSISNNVVLTSTESITDVDGAVINVQGTATINAVAGSVTLDGQNNDVARFNLNSTDVELNLSASTVLAAVLADTLTITNSSGDVSVESGAELFVDERFTATADHITIFDSEFQIGGLELTGRESVTIESDIKPRLVNNVLLGTGTLTIYSPEVTLGADNQSINISTQSRDITITGLGDQGVTGADLGIINLAGEVNLDTTAGFPEIDGSINLVRDSDGSKGQIDRLAGTTGTTALTMNAGIGDIVIGDLGTNNPIESFNILSAADTLLSDIIVGGNTINIDISGGLVVSGLMEEALGDINITTGGNVELQAATSAAGNITLTSAESISTQQVTAEANLSVTADAEIVVESDLVAAGSVAVTSNTGSVSTQTVSSGDTLAISAASDINLLQSVIASDTITIVSSTGAVDARQISGSNDVAVTADSNIQIGQAAELQDPDQSTLESSSGSITVTSTKGTVSNSGQLNANDNISLSALQTVSLGSTTTASNGLVRIISSSGGVETANTVTSGGDTIIAAKQDITIDAVTASEDEVGVGISSGGELSVASLGNLVFNGNLNSELNVAIVSNKGSVTQKKNSIIKANGGSLTIQAAGDIAIAQVAASQDVTLIITTSEVAEGAIAPQFRRVNDPIPLGQGDGKPDIQAGSEIVFLAPVANVGSPEPNDNFVQRADAGIFYGLEQGKFFSDDIGATAILTQVPAGTVENLESVTASVLNLGIDSAAGSLPIGIESPLEIDIVGLTALLSGSSSAIADAGETSVASSTRSTAASQRDDEEDTAEVDEAAFQELKNYDENPQGILLPEDQQFAYDDNGDIYFLVDFDTRLQYGNRFALYRISLDLADSTSTITSTLKRDLNEHNQTEADDNYVVRRTLTTPVLSSYSPAFQSMSPATQGGE